MGNKNYIIIDKSSFIKGGKLCLKNAQNHFKAAELLAEKEKYGLGNSHLVLAAEEASKAYILLARSIIGNKEKKSFKELFRYHKPKQEMSQGLSVLLIMQETMWKDIFEWQFEYDGTELTEKKRQELSERATLETQKHIEWLEGQLNDDSTLGRLSQWWKQANNLKNSGFYVDFVNSKWESPNDFTKEKFEESREHVKYLIDQISNFKTLLLKEPEQIQKFYKSYLKDLNQ